MPCYQAALTYNVFLTCTGETEGLARLEKVLGGGMQTGRSGSSFAANFSQEVSPWLAMGCLSPTLMYKEVSGLSSQL